MIEAEFNGYNMSNTRFWETQSKLVKKQAEHLIYEYWISDK